ncbi:hypothetical protein FRB98_006445 [Tulasnella sp. 332]|nr:hypothetical protein FRB98_006445 [Tulasnella sp. 332]
MTSDNIVPIKQGVLPVKQVNIDKQDAFPTHPLDALTPAEITALSYALRAYVAEHRKDIKAVKFINCNLIAPPKRDVLAALGIRTVPGKPAEKSTKVLPRRGETDFADPVTGINYNASLKLDPSTKAWTVEVIETLAEGVQPQITVEELIECDELVRSDPVVLKLAAEVGLKPEQLYADGWSIGWDARWPSSRRIQQCLLYGRLSPHENLYAHPLDFIPVVDVNMKKVIHVDFPPHRVVKKQLSATTVPPPLDHDPVTASGRPRIPPPMRQDNYLPDLLETQPNHVKSNIEPLKPLHVVQPEGVSFRMIGSNELEWQAWKMHIAFGQREGIVLSTITYNDNGDIRPVMYRLTLAEMVVPYAAPEHPHPRKHAFDVGEYGMGTQANELSLGCDCVGAIHYLVSRRSGKAMSKPQADTSRLGSLTTGINSDQVFLETDGTIELEMKLTGILNAYVLADGESAAPYAVQVAPNISAQYHQHVFSFRVDPMIDGLNNTVVQSDIVTAKHATGSDENFAGNAFTSEDLRISNSSLAIQDYDATKDRRWRIVNPNKKHYASGKEASYGIMGNAPWVVLQGAPGSNVRERAAFAEHSMWVVKDVEGPLGSERQWPSGKYVPQTRKSPLDSVGNWVKEAKDENLEGEDVVLFMTVGVTHIPRPEDWPVMPSEHMRIAFKPQNFFDRNPSLHILPENDKRSVAAFAGAPQVNAANGNGINGAEGVHTHDNAACCN